MGEHSWKYWSLSISTENWNLSSERLDPQTLSLGRSGMAEGEAAGSLWGDLNEVWTLNGDLGIITCSEPHRFYYYQSLPSADTHYSLPDSSQEEPSLEKLVNPEKNTYKNLGESPYETFQVLSICYYEATIDKFHPQTQSFSSWVYEQMVIGPLTWKATAAAAAKSLQSCLTLCDPTDGSPPGSAIPGILQARTLEWVAISFSNVWKWKVKVKSLSRVQLVATPWTAAYQAPPSLGFSRRVLEWLAFSNMEI